MDYTICDLEEGFKAVFNGENEVVDIFSGDDAQANAEAFIKLQAGQS